MLLAEDKILELLKIELFHVNFLLPGALRVVVLIALRVLAFNSSAASALLAGKALTLEPLMVYVLDPLDTYHSIFLLEEAFRHPNGTDIVYPDIMAHRGVRRVS